MKLSLWPMWAGKSGFGGFQFGDLKPSCSLGRDAVYPSAFLGAKHSQLSLWISLSLSLSFSVLPLTNIYLFLSQFCHLMTRVVLLFEGADGSTSWGRKGAAGILEAERRTNSAADHLYGWKPQVYGQHSMGNIKPTRQRRTCLGCTLQYMCIPSRNPS